MITAVDTNVLLDLLTPNELFVDASSIALDCAARDGSLVICDIVYAQLSAHFTGQRQCDEFLDELGIREQPTPGLSSPTALKFYRSPSHPPGLWPYVCAGQAAVPLRRRCPGAHPHWAPEAVHPGPPRAEAFPDQGVTSE